MRAKQEGRVVCMLVLVRCMRLMLVFVRGMRLVFGMRLVVLSVCCRLHRLSSKGIPFSQSNLLRRGGLCALCHGLLCRFSLCHCSLSRCTLCRFSLCHCSLFLCSRCVSCLHP